MVDHRVHSYKRPLMSFLFQKPVRHQHYEPSNQGGSFQFSSNLTSQQLESKLFGVFRSGVLAICSGEDSRRVAKVCIVCRVSRTIMIDNSITHISHMKLGFQFGDRLLLEDSISQICRAFSPSLPFNFIFKIFMQYILIIFSFVINSSRSSPPLYPFNFAFFLSIKK